MLNRAADVNDAILLNKMESPRARLEHRKFALSSRQNAKIVFAIHCATDLHVRTIEATKGVNAPRRLQAASNAAAERQRESE